jgi:hypothetical protein
MYYCTVEDGAFVFEVGKIGHCFFVVERGSL